MSVRIITHPSSLEHSAGPGHPESPQRLHAILDELRSPAYADVVTWEQSEPAPWEDLERVHPRAHLERLEALSARGGGMLDYDTFLNAASFNAARHAAGAGIAMVGAALDGVPAFAAVRPPGHHATADVAMGFCLINSVVVAARHATDARGLRRVLIVDWDVHHGNGTQALVDADERIRYVSIHQWPLYPGTGQVDERGVGNIFNVPRPPGLPRESYLADLNAAVGAATDGWEPELFLISAGFDAMAGDPLAGFTLEPEDYATWVQTWSALDVPTTAILEGGYAPDRIRLAAGAMVRALARRSSP